MKYPAFVSLVFGAYGNTSGASWFFDNSVMGAEPMRLVFWGVALIVFSNSVRARLVSNTAPERRVDMSATMELPRIGTSIPRTV